MSAYIVDRAHIDYLVGAALYMRTEIHGLKMRWQRNGRRIELTEANATEVGQMLWDECIKSVQHRYHGESIDQLPGPNGDSFEYKFRCRLTQPYDPVQVIKACHCLEYQSCEHPKWEGSEAHAFIESLESRAIREIPGYEEAEWGAPKQEGAGNG